mgnify:FL=1
MTRSLLLALAMLPAAALAGPRIDCYVSNEGETRVIVARPAKSLYAEVQKAIGDSFLFKLSFQDRPADIAGISIATYAPAAGSQSGPVMIHQANYPWPPPRPGRHARHGFTGLQRVFEPAFDGELEYWCEAVTEGAR